MGARWLRDRFQLLGDEGASVCNSFKSRARKTQAWAVSDAQVS